MPPESILAVDLGGTQMRAALVAADGSISHRRALPTPGAEDGVEQLLELAGAVLAHGARAGVIAVPGRVDYGQGRLEHAPNLPKRWSRMLTQSYLGERLGVEIALANDADAAAVGETFFGAGRGHDDVSYLTISTGIGTGVLLGRRLMHGRRSSAELGHTVVAAIAAATGAPATLEDLASGRALESSARTAGLAADARRVVELVKQGDARAQRIWHSFLDVVMLGVVNLAYLFTPQIIVIGGGVGLNGDLLLEPIRKHVARYGPPGLPKPIPIVTAALGDDAGLMGAAAWREAFGATVARTGTCPEPKESSVTSHIRAERDIA
jgi:glucokinase